VNTGARSKTGARPGRTSSENFEGISVVVYTRVSTSEQAQAGLSLDVQRARCEAYATALGLDVVRVCEDAGRSGSSLNRDGVREALSLVRELRGALLVYSLDRLTRSVGDLVSLIAEVRAGAFELVSVTDNLNTRTAAGRLVVHVLGAVAQWQREQGAEKVSDALAHARESGARLGRLPLGLRRGTDRDAAGRLVVEVDEAGAKVRAQILELARRYRCDGVGEDRPRYKRGALAEVAERLNRAGVKTPRGALWRAESVRRVLLSS